ncbi:MAG: hypothetical protein H7339_18320 [Arcicella sp.]|nr:hypothetical protein [Arcicella sp.]
MPLGKYFTVILATAIKFFNGPIAGLLLDLSWVETALCSIIGMMTTVVLVCFIGLEVRILIKKYRKTEPKLFSKRSRFAVRIWHRLGIWGIACFTPLLFTPIGGTLLALSFKVPIPKIMFSMLVFAVFWGIILTFAIFQISELRHLFE